MLALVKGIREPHEVKKKSFDLGGNQTSCGSLMLFTRANAQLVQSNWGQTLNKLQQKVFQRIMAHSDVLNNISKVPKNRSSGRPEKRKRKFPYKAYMKTTGYPIYITATILLPQYSNNFGPGKPPDCCLS